MSVWNLVSAAGIAGLAVLGWCLSSDRRVINWRAVRWGIGLQLGFAAFIFKVPAGARIFEWVNAGVVRLLDCASAGALFLFGRLAVPPGAKGPGGEESLGFVLAFQAFPTIVFFSALMAMLYYWNIMPRVIRGFARVFTRAMGVSGAESLCAASNIFVGIESALTVKPHLARMTRSELCTVLTAGLATVSSNVLAFYVFCLRDVFPGIAGHLVSASILSAPAAIVMSKLVLPETGQPVTLGRDISPYAVQEASLFEAVIRGANDGLRLIGGIVALLLAVLGLVAVVDAGLGAVTGWVNGLTGWSVDGSLRGLLGYAFYPLTLALGVVPADAVTVARIIGERSVATEVVGYQDLAVALRAGALQDPRSAVIAAYALCGFAHVASMAIFVGGVSALAPERTGDLARVAWRALAAATLACLMTAAVAGLFATGGATLLGAAGGQP